MSDYIKRAITQDGEFRAIAVDATQTVRACLEGVELDASATETFAKAVVGTLLIRSAIHPAERFQFVMKNTGLIREMRVDAWPEGLTRGYLHPRSAEAAQKGDAGVFSVTQTRRLRRDEPYESILRTQSGNITDEVERFLQFSAQIEASVRIETSQDAEGRLMWAAGVLAMPLPEAERGDIEKLIAHLESMPELATVHRAGDPEALVRAAVPEGYPFSVVAEEAVSKNCVCDPQRIKSALVTLGSEQLTEMADEGETLAIDCAYCPSRVFHVTVDELRALADPS